MLPLTLSRKRGALSILAIGAHSDDIEIGCGGTLLTLLEAHPGSRVAWVVLSGHGTRAREARRSARRVLGRTRNQLVRVESFRDGFLPYSGAAVKEVFESLKPVAPDLVFTHYRHDAHQDHRLVAELSWNTFRDHTILEYEIPKYDADLATPGIFVPISDRIRRKKLRLLMSAFPSQSIKRWYSEETFNGLMRIRGIECASPTGYAEAFHGRKLTLSFGSASGTR